MAQRLRSGPRLPLLGNTGKGLPCKRNRGPAGWLRAEELEAGRGADAWWQSAQQRSNCTRGDALGAGPQALQATATCGSRDEYRPPPTDCTMSAGPPHTGRPQRPLRPAEPPFVLHSSAREPIPLWGVGYRGEGGGQSSWYVCSTPRLPSVPAQARLPEPSNPPHAPQQSLQAARRGASPGAAGTSFILTPGARVWRRRGLPSGPERCPGVAGQGPRLPAPCSVGPSPRCRLGG